MTAKKYAEFQCFASNFHLITEIKAKYERDFEPARDRQREQMKFITFLLFEYTELAHT